MVEIFIILFNNIKVKANRKVAFFIVRNFFLTGNNELIHSVPFLSISPSYCFSVYSIILCFFKESGESNVLMGYLCISDTLSIFSVRPKVLRLKKIPMDNLTTFSEWHFLSII